MRGLKVWRFRTGSLTVRIPVMLVAVQAGCIVLAFLVFPLLAPFTTYTTIADSTARSLIEASLVRDAQGALRIVPTPALRRYAGARPALSYAVLEPGGGLAGGSMPDMAGLLRRLGAALPVAGGNLETRRPGALGGSAFVTIDSTRFGELAVATAGNAFQLGDVPSFVMFFLPAVVPAYGPVLIGALVILPLLLRGMLRPLRAVAQAASGIDLRAIDRRLPTADLPSELRPAVAAINTALDRLEDGWARQNLFTANAAHELRTPVAILQARIDAMAPGAVDRPALARDARRLRLLVDQLLAVARLERREAVAWETVDLVPVVRALVADCAPLALRNGRAIAFHPLLSGVVVNGDRRALEGVVANLIDNALRAEPEGGTVDVVVCQEGGGVIEVRDHGVGVAPGDRALVFEPFWRKDDRSAGTGLGLAAVREVVRLHGGSAGVGETPGGGATFRIELPPVSPAQ